MNSVFGCYAFALTKVSWCFDKVRECTKSATIEERLWEIAVLKMSAHAIFKVQHQHGNNLWKQIRNQHRNVVKCNIPKKTSDVKIACLQFWQKKQRWCVFTGRPLTDKGKQVEADIWWAFSTCIFSFFLLTIHFLIFFVLVNFVFFCRQENG